MIEILKPEQVEYLTKIHPSVTDPFLAQLEDYASEKRVPILNWLAYNFLEQLVLIKKPKIFLELGTAIAYTSIRIAKILPASSKVITTEKSKNNIVIARQNVIQSGLNDKIEVYFGEAADYLKNMSIKADFIFLDADKEVYSELFELALKVLDKDGIIVVDNLLWHGNTASNEVPEGYKKSTELIRKFNLEFLSCKELRTSIYPVGDGLGVGVKI